MLLNRKHRREVADIAFKDVKVSERTAPRYRMNGKEVDIWDEPYAFYHSKSPIEYVRERILGLERKGVDPFPSVVGKSKEKELVKNALLSGSPILFRGLKGYGKTTFSKAIAQLLPEKLLTVKGCKVNDDPTRPICFSCKKKVLEDDNVEVAWTPRVWIRIPGDPMLTTRQLIGGISIQKIREGFDLDHPEVFVPGRALKANRGVGYFDELGAIPSQLQTLLHELIEEGQVTTPEGDVVPFRVDALFVAATNPANYRGTTPIKEPLLDRMEVIEIGPPESLYEEIEIGLRNMYVARKGLKPRVPAWHLKTLARITRLARDKERGRLARLVSVEPSCRATIKLFDHVKSAATMHGREVPLLEDYGPSYSNLKLALRGRMEFTYEAREAGEELMEKLVEEALNETCREVYGVIPSNGFEKIYQALVGLGVKKEDGWILVPISRETSEKLSENGLLKELVEKYLAEGDLDPEDEYLLSGLEIILEAISRCTTLARRTANGYLLKVAQSEA